MLSMSILIWAISPNHTKVRICSEPSRRNSEYFHRRAVVQKQVFLGEKRVSNRIILPGTCWNKNDNFRIFTLNHIFPRGDQRWKIFLEPIQLCPWLLLFAEKRSILKSEQGGPTLSAEKKSGLKTMTADRGTRGNPWNVVF